MKSSWSSRVVLAALAVFLMAVLATPVLAAGKVTLVSEYGIHT